MCKPTSEVQNRKLPVKTIIFIILMLVFIIYLLNGGYDSAATLVFLVFSYILAIKGLIFLFKIKLLKMITVGGILGGFGLKLAVLAICALMLITPLFFTSFFLTTFTDYEPSSGGGYSRSWGDDD